MFKFLLTRQRHLFSIPRALPTSPLGYAQLQPAAFTGCTQFSPAPWWFPFPYTIIPTSMGMLDIEQGRDTLTCSTVSIRPDGSWRMRQRLQPNTGQLLTAHTTARTTPTPATYAHACWLHLQMCGRRTAFCVLLLRTVASRTKTTPTGPDKRSRLNIRHPRWTARLCPRFG